MSLPIRRRHKPVDGRCQLVVDFDPRTETFITCGNPITRHGAWLYCRAEHADLARDQYQAIRNPIDVRLHRFRREVLDPFNMYLAREYDSSLQLAVGWRLDWYRADVITFEFCDPTSSLIPPGILSPRSLTELQREYHKLLQILKIRWIDYGHKVTPVLFLPPWLGPDPDAVYDISVNLKRPNVKRPTQNMKISWIIKSLKHQLFQNEELVRHLLTIHRKATRISYDIMPALSVLTVIHHEVTQNGNQCVFREDLDLCTET